MNKIFLIFTLSIFSCGLISDDDNYYVLGLGQADCGDFISGYELKDKEIRRVYLAYAQGVINSFNTASVLVYEFFDNKQFAPKSIKLATRTWFKYMNKKQ